MSQYPVPIPDMITSTANDEVKRLRALHETNFDALGVSAGQSNLFL